MPGFVPVACRRVRRGYCNTKRPAWQDWPRAAAALGNHLPVARQAFRVTRPGRTMSTMSMPGPQAAAVARGTEESPWWGLATAVEQLTRLDHVGQIELRAGQTVRLAHREVFTATSVERWKKVKENIARFVFLSAALVPDRAHGGDPDLPAGAGLAGPLVFFPCGKPAELHDGRGHLGAAGGNFLAGAGSRS